MKLATSTAIDGRRRYITVAGHLPAKLPPILGGGEARIGVLAYTSTAHDSGADPHHRLDATCRVEPLTVSPRQQEGEG